MENIKQGPTPLDQEERDLKNALEIPDVEKLEKPSAATQNQFKKTAANYAEKKRK